MFFINVNELLECSEFELGASHIVMCKLLMKGLRHQEVNGNWAPMGLKNKLFLNALFQNFREV